MGENNVGELKQLATSIPSFSRPMQASLATFFFTSSISYCQKYTIRNLDFILSNGIIFVLYNLHYMDQIDDLGTHPELVN
jgi:hypothetical protein